MNTYVRRALVACTASLAVLSTLGTSHAALLGRDINGQAVALSSPQAVFVYDDVANLTWLRDFAAGGLQNAADARAWTDALVMAGFSDWRLPRNAFAFVPGCTVACQGELTYLWKDVLGNTTMGAPFQTGPFTNLGLSSGLWIHESAPSGFTDVFVLATGSNLPGIASSALGFGVVRTGDVLTSISPVPEPKASLMGFAGLLALVALAAHRRLRR